MQKDEIWTVEVPGIGGHTQTGHRPVLVLASGLPSVVVIAPFTTNARAGRFPHTIHVSPTDKNGLSVTSILMIFQVTAIDRRFAKKKIGILEKATSKEVKENLRTMFSL